jgi:S-DNA-T family DNA segregation ATPase FtsK/SpoIIIE
MILTIWAGIAILNSMNKNKIKNETVWHEVFSISVMMLALLLFIALVSYSSEDPVKGWRNLITRMFSDSAGPVRNWVGRPGAQIAANLYDVLGISCLIFPLMMFLFGWYMFLKRELRPFFRLSAYLLIFGLYLSTVLAMPEAIYEEHNPGAPLGIKYNNYIHGTLGLFFAKGLYKLKVGSFIVLITFFIIFILTATSWSMRGAVLSLRESIRSSWYSLMQKRKTTPRKPEMQSKEKTAGPIPIHGEPEPAQTELKIPAQAPQVTPPGRPEIRKPEQPQGEKKTVPARPQDTSKTAGSESKASAAEYQRPPIGLLNHPAEQDLHIDREALEERAHFLEEKLREFDVQGTVTGIQPGPVITRFEISPAPGVKVNKFLNVQDDLALVMKATRVRVVAPIPGKAAVGIEIPNEKPSIVTLREILVSKAFQRTDFQLPIALGKTIEGKPFVADLTHMPHLLVAGATGSGKSVCLNTILMSLLFRFKPDQVRLVLIDPKKLVLNLYRKLKHHHLTTREDLSEDVITSVENAVAVLRSLESEMERRYRVLAHVGVRNIQQFNSTAAGKIIKTAEGEKKLPTLPYIILVVDELADLMLTGAREIEEPIARLAQMSRAVGLHLILATQRPSVDVITGVIKANFPARIAFQVAAKTDSRTILDRNGAEKLLGRGDMLFLTSREPEPVRVHGANVTTEEIQRTVAFISQQPQQETYRLLSQTSSRTAEQNPEKSGVRDELFWEAAKLVVRHNQGSASLLQRRLRVGYARAGRLIDELEEAGILGPFEGSKSREVLVDEAYINTLYDTEKTQERSKDL